MKKNKVFAFVLCAILVWMLLPTTVFAYVDEEFMVQSSDATPVAVKVKVLTEPYGTIPGTVQVGDGIGAAVTLTATSVTLDTVIHDGKTYEVTAVGDAAFSGCASLTTVNMPNATVIGALAFQWCSSLSTVQLPEATVIGYYAFSGCTSLSTVTLPKATSIGIAAFGECSSLSTVDLPEATTIGDSAFDGCAVLLNVELPQVTTIGKRAFRDCETLATIDLPEATTIEAFAFLRCHALTAAELPKVTAIGDSAFFDCYELTDVDMPAATTIGAIAFRACTSLTAPYLPKATTIGESAFRGCNAFTTINLPEAITIGDYAFENCRRLTDVFIPKATSIGEYAFNTCAALDTVTIWQTSVPSLGSEAFGGVSSACTLYVPHNSIADYSATNGWPSTVLGLWPISGIVYNSAGIAADGAIVSVYDEYIQTNPSGEYTTYINNTSATIYAQIEGEGERSIYVSDVHGALTGQNIYFSTVATPTFSLTTGSYMGTQSVTLLCATPGAIIRYTTDGTVPNENSTRYTEAISISRTATLSAKAFARGLADSDTASETFTITPMPPTVSSVAVNPMSVSVDKGGTQTFNATVTGEYEPEQTVIWNVTGNTSAFTTINADGELTVDANETAATITVTATSTLNPAKSGSATVTVATRYEITQGASSTWIQGSADGLVITADADYADFLGVTIDGSDVASSNYTSESGSTIVTLKPKYLETLTAGNHTIRLNFANNGYAQTMFTVSVTNIPATADSSNTVILFCIAVMAAIGIGLSLAIGRKRKNG